MFEIKPTGSQTFDQAVEQAKAQGFYVATSTVDGKTVSYALTLDEYMLTTGIKSVEAQDKILAALMGQMEGQTKNLTDINDCLQAINGMLTAAANEPKLAYMSAEETQQVKDAINTLNTWLKAHPGATYNGKVLTAITFPNPLTASGLYSAWVQMQDTTLAAGLTSNAAVWNACGVAHRAGSGAPTQEIQDKLNALVASGILNLGGIDITKGLTTAQLETIQKNLSTAQSSQGALNEDISLKLNEAASKRSAIFTQLQTLLQTLMQTRNALSRW